MDAQLTQYDCFALNRLFDLVYRAAESVCEDSSVILESHPVSHTEIGMTYRYSGATIRMRAMVEPSQSNDRMTLYLVTQHDCGQISVDEATDYERVRNELKLVSEYCCQREKLTTSK